MTCPWHITAYAVERYQALVPQAARDFEAARDELVELAAGIWERYERNRELSPTVTRTGAYQYRGGLPLRLVVVVVAAPDAGAFGQWQLVDVVGADLRRAHREQRAVDRWAMSRPEFREDVRALGLRPPPPPRSSRSRRGAR